MILYNEYFQSVAEVNKLGFPNVSETRIPIEYLNNQQFILFRTCHSYGDWVLLSAMPRLLKQKYPDCTVAIPSPKCIAKYFSPNSWFYKHNNPFNNVIEIFKNNPYVDGMIDEIPQGIPIYHDHFRIYDPNNADIPLIQQMLKFWRFEDYEMEDCQPELYWDKEEQQIGDKIIKELFNSKPFGFLYVDDLYVVGDGVNHTWYSEDQKQEKLEYKRSLIQKEINKHNLPWLYYSGKNDFTYKTDSEIINIKNIDISLRVQQYIKSKSTLVIGHQGGYGTDCMPRYTKCYVVPLVPGFLAEHILLDTVYLY
jgi:hypothetical protein